MDRRAWQMTVHGVAKSRTQLSDFHLSTIKNISHILIQLIPHNSPKRQQMLLSPFLYMKVLRYRKVKHFFQGYTAS